MSSAQFVLMYHPALGNAQALIARQAIDDQATKGWLLVDPNEPPPTPITPYVTQAAADSRYLKLVDYTPGGGGGTAADATPTTKGLLQLAGDLGGTAAAPTVPGLAGKANTAHTHPVTDLTATGTRDATTFLRGDNTWATPPTSGGGGTVTAANITDATTVGRNVLTSADAASARSVIGAGTSSLTLGTTGTTAKAGNYTPTKTDVGLGNVDNTSDANKPVSTAQQTALDAKAASASGFTVVTPAAGAYPATRPTGVGRVWFDDPAVTPPSWAAARDRWASA